MRARRNWIPALAATTLVFGCQAAPGDVAALDPRVKALIDDARVRAHELMAKRTAAIK